MARFDPAWWAARARYSDPGRASPAAKRRFLRWAAPWVRRAFRPTIEGLERLPEGPFLLVANHSAGIALAELASFSALWFERAGDRRLAALAHPLSFHFWPMTAAMRWTGAIPSSYEAAYDALGRGVPVLVFPGGDHEASRPFWQANVVDFAGRKGFLRIARTARVPIVPMGISGSHLTAPILYRSGPFLPWLLVLPRLFGLRRFPVSVLGALGALALLLFAPPAVGWPLTVALVIVWLGSPLTFLPVLPRRIRFRIGAPIAPGDLFGGGAEQEELRQAYDEVVASIESLVRPPRASP